MRLLIPPMILKTFLIALSCVEGTGLNTAAYKNPMSLDMVLVSYKLLAVGMCGLIHWHSICGRRLHIYL